DWSIQGGGTCTAASLRLLDAALDFADVFQVVADTCTIPRAEPTLKTGSLFRDRIENTPLHLNPLQPFAGRACFAEESLESKARIGFHRQWSGRRTPGYRVHVSATETGRASPDVTGEVFGRQLNRWQRRVQTDLHGNNLIDGRIG